MLTVLTFLAATAQPALTRPVPPALPAMNAADCADPVLRKARMKAFDDDSWGDYGEAIDAYSDAWQSYTDAKFRRLGMTEQEQADFLDRVSQSSPFAAMSKDTLGLLDQLAKDSEKLDEADDDHDEASCRIAIHTLGLLPHLMDNIRKQWELVDSAIDAEAKRRGISLD